jgi:5-methylcytosine-specific restriction protein B
LQAVPALSKCEPILSNQGSLFSVTADEYEAIRALIDERNIGTQLSQPASFTKADALAGLFMSPGELDAILARLKRKKALILQGPPGVGKTFIARRLAFALMGKKDDRRVKMIQFHPSYGYEDFVQGFRPTRTGLERRDGVFYQFARLARNDPKRDWFFIIDEINRGNLAKIFGELLMLIEADKRGPDHAIPLTYSEGPDETFYLPANLHFIGTMNTADRSLAMVDYALRRRFAFVILSPAMDSPGFAAWLKERKASDALIARIRAKIGNLNEIIEKERDLGPGFRIGHSFFCPPDGQTPDEAWYREVIAGEIQPLLEEYFDSRERVEKLVAELLA